MSHNIKEGDRVVLYLDEVIAENLKKKSKIHLVKFWKAINGKSGIVTNVVSDDEIWVCGDKTNVNRMFTKTTLRKIL